jgi:hypothetical protein
MKEVNNPQFQIQLESVQHQSFPQFEFYEIMTNDQFGDRGL